MHHKASAVLAALQQRGDPADAFAELQRTYPTIKPERLAADLLQIIQGLKEHGTLQPGEFRPYTIRTAVTPQDDKHAERIKVRNTIDRTGLTIRDYARMGRSLLAATRLIRSHTLYDVANTLRDMKASLPYSTPERAERLMRAGHVINRYAGLGACVEQSVGVILAESRQGRRVDFALGIGSFPRQFHAWPVVDGKPVQTEYDEIIEGQFTAFDVW